MSASTPQITTVHLWRDPSTVLTGAALLVVAGLSWAGVVQQSASMDMAGMAGSASGMDMADMHMPATATSQASATLAEAAIYVAAWGVMMAAMMLPSALPMIALYRTVSRKLSRSGQQVIPTAVFTATYLAAWLLFGIPVYAAGEAVTALTQAVPAVAAVLPYGVGFVLLTAGAYQFSAVKRRCLTQCQDPLTFLMNRWRSGYAATLRLGFSHAAYCIGCCWGLMAVLVAAGAMSLPWVLLITLLVFAEKLLPGRWAATATGLALGALGAAVLINPEIAASLRGARPPTMATMAM